MFIYEPKPGERYRFQANQPLGINQNYDIEVMILDEQPNAPQSFRVVVLEKGEGDDTDLKVGSVTPVSREFFMHHSEPLFEDSVG